MGNKVKRIGGRMSTIFFSAEGSCKVIASMQRWQVGFIMMKGVDSCALSNAKNYTKSFNNASVFFWDILTPSFRQFRVHQYYCMNTVQYDTFGEIC